MAKARASRACRASIRHASRSRHQPVESLERRTLLAGVTVFVHEMVAPFGSNAPAYLDDMGAAISRRQGDVGAVQEVSVFPTAIPKVVDSIKTTWAEGVPGLAGQVLTVSWASASQYMLTAVSAGEVANEILPYLLDETVDGHPLAEVPIHLIGFERGASVVTWLAKQLGEHGVWVEHLTFLEPRALDWTDPQPLPLTVFDADIKVYENVLFADNYYQTDGGILGLGTHGHAVDGTYGVDLTNLPGMSSGAVQRWYYGTVDLGDNAREIPGDDDTAINPAWYGNGTPARHVAGFNLAHAVAGAKPGSGLGTLDGGGADRVSVSIDDSNPYSNVGGLVLDNPTGGGAGGGGIIHPTRALSYRYQDVPGGAAVSFFLDDDTDPYNNSNPILLAADAGIPSTGDSFASATRSVDIPFYFANLAPGLYHVEARIENVYGKTRYDYMELPLYVNADGYASLVTKRFNVDWQTRPNYQSEYRWNDGRNWLPTGVPAAEDNVLVSMPDWWYDGQPPMTLVPPPQVTLQSGAYSAAAGNILLTGGTQVLWKSGNIDGVITVAPSSLFQAVDGGYKTFSGALRNSGEVLWEATDADIDPSSAIDNLSGGRFSIGAGVLDSNALPNFHNHAGATFVKYGPDTATLFIPFLNEGTVDVVEGDLTFEESLVNAGQVVTRAGAKLTLRGITGAGSYTSEGLTVFSGACEFSSLFAGTGSYELGPWGTFTGPITLADSATVTWTGGTLLGDVTVPQGATFNISGPNAQYAQDMTFDVAGLLTWNGTYNYLDASGSTFVIRPAGRWFIDTPCWISGSTTGAPPVVLNSGAIDVDTHGQYVLATARFTNLAGAVFSLLDGEFDVRDRFDNQAGATVRALGASTFHAEYDGEHDGAFHADPAASIRLGGTTTFGPNTAFAGSGLYYLFGPSTMSSTRIAAADFRFAGDIAGSFQVDGSATWLSGTVTASVAVSPGATLQVGREDWTGDKVLAQTTLDNRGTLRIEGRNSAELRATSIVNHPSATIDIHGDGAVVASGWYTPSSLTNLSAITKTAGTDEYQCYLSVPVDNQGSLDVQSGTLHVTAALRNTGSARARAGTTLQLDGGGTVDGTVTADAGGAVRYEYGDFTFAPQTALVGQGTHVLNGRILGTLTLAPRSVWWGASVDAGLTLPVGSSLDVAGPNFARYFRGSLANHGTVTWTGLGSLQLHDPATRIDNYGTFNITSDSASLDCTFSAPATFNNYGTLARSAGTGDVALTPHIVNTGLISVAAGNVTTGPIDLGSPAAVVHVSPGARLTTNGLLTASAGTLSNGGTFVVNNGLAVTGTPRLAGASRITLALYYGNELSISPAGTLDLQSASLYLAYSSFAQSDSVLPQVRQYLAAGRNGGSWNGVGGIASSAAANDKDRMAALGYTELDTAGNSWSAAKPAGVLLAYTRCGDSDLDGKVDADDYVRADRGRLLGRHDWWAGDFDYDGVVTGADLTLLDRSFVTASVPLGPAPVTLDEPVVAGTGPEVPPSTTPVTAAVAAPLTVPPPAPSGPTVVSVTGPATVRRGKAETLSLAAMGVPAKPTRHLRFAIDWDGDGRADQFLTARAAARVKHRFGTTGVFNVTVAIVDRGGHAVSRPERLAVSVR